MISFTQLAKTAGMAADSLRGQKPEAADAHGALYAQGYAKGYARGWQRAVERAKRVIAKKQAASDAQAAAAEAKWQGACAELQGQNEALQAELKRLHAQHDQLQHQNQHLMHSFLGVVAMAGPAVDAVAALPLAERMRVVGQYGEEAIRLLTQAHVVAHRFPHNQPFIQNHLPAAHRVFNDTIAQINQHSEVVAPVLRQVKDLQTPMPVLVRAG